VLLDEQGAELARVEGSACAIDPAAPERSALAIAPLVRGVKLAAGLADAPCSLWAGVAGAGRTAARIALERELRRAEVADRVVVGTDLAAAFFAAFGGGPGVLLISGTGSVVQGRNAAGDEARAGGWGRILGDEGSGFLIGMKALRSLARMEDKTGPATVLGAELLPEIGLGDTEGLVAWVASAEPGAVAALAPLVCATAEAGDAEAQKILASASSALVRLTRSVLDRLGPWEDRPELVLEGGMIRPGCSLRESAVAALSELPVSVRDEPVDAALGAARLAMQKG